MTYTPDENNRLVIFEKYYGDGVIIKYHTKNCIFCFETPTLFGGHVHQNTIKIITGFCNKHEQLAQNLDFNKKNRNCQGCFGDYKIEMGKK